MRVRTKQITKGGNMTSLERTLITAQIRRRRWFPRILIVTAIASIYFFSIDVAILMFVSVSVVSWGLLSSTIDETEEIMRIRR